jgi:hypothetical protein
MFFEVSDFGNPGTMPALPLLMVHPPEQHPSMVKATVRRDHILSGVAAEHHSFFYALDDRFHDVAFTSPASPSPS